MYIKNKKLPKGLKRYIKDQNKNGGNVKLSYKYLTNAVIEDGIIEAGQYFEDNTKLEWIEKDNILYIFVDDVNVCYYDNKDGLIYI